MAVSLAMFGTTAGAGAVFLAPRFFEAHRATFQMGVSSLLFAASTVGSVLILTGTRFVPEISWESLDSLTFIYVIAAIPFIFSGVCITLALTRFPARVGTLYAADLVGSGPRVPGVCRRDRHDRCRDDGLRRRLVGGGRFLLLPGP
ncbi:MAG: hypothetical protein VCF24_16785 [Candidatus Latescibacterota bacterium]